MNKIRASSLPRIMSCPASLKRPEVWIEPRREEAEMGTAVHAVLDDIVKSSMESVPDLDPYIKKFEVDADELRFLAWRGMEIWNTFKPMLDEQSIESERELVLTISDEHRLVGHVDVCAFLADTDQSTLVVIDWKSGYVEREYMSQLMGYALLAYWNQEHSDDVNYKPQAVKIVTAWLRAGTWDVLDVTPEGLDDFEWRLIEVVEMQDEKFSPDDAHCIYCPRASECPAKAQMIQSAIRNLWPAEYKAHNLTDRDKLGVLYSQAQSLKRVLKDYDDAIKDSIRKEGPISIPGGGALSLQECIRQTIHYDDAAGHAIAPHLGVAAGKIIEALGGGALTLSKDALLKAVGNRAPRGAKADAKRAVIADLETAGCIQTTPYDKLTPLSAKQIEQEK